MREIKFRAWHKIQKRIFDVYGFDKDNVYEESLNDYLETVHHRSKCDLSQFTGLQDRAGKDVYEGDILENYHKEKYEIIYGVNKTQIVRQNNSQTRKKFLSSGFYEKQIGQDINAYVELCDCKWGVIIGNIYENPELLEVKK